MRASVLLFASACLVVACGSSPPRESAPPPAPGASSGAATPSPVPAGGGDAGASTPGASSASPPKGGPRLVRLSTAEPECALDAEGRPWRWPSGKLERSPVNVKGAKAISCSRTHTCVVAEDASAQCWGEGTFGALGDGTQNASPETAVTVKGLTNVAEIVVDTARSCARTTSGDVYCWGDREFAKAGDGTLIDGHKGREKPLAGKPVLGLSGAASLAVSLIHACAATADGSVMCWGQCRSGACGLPPKPPWIARATRAPKVTGIASLAAAENATCGIDKAGAVSCWGSSQYGVLGDAVTDTKPHDAPSKIALPGPAAEVAVGMGGHACARLTSGAVHCWGHNEHGELGDGTKTDRKAPAPAKGMEKAKSIAAGLDATCAIDDAGRLSCWGQKYGPAPVPIAP